eukprot:COSAG06_NODE_1689_length_8706_cov_7.834669_11_plen_133_part_00
MRVLRAPSLQLRERERARARCTWYYQYSIAAGTGSYYIQDSSNACSRWRSKGLLDDPPPPPPPRGGTAAVSCVADLYTTVKLIHSRKIPQTDQGPPPLRSPAALTSNYSSHVLRAHTPPLLSDRPPCWSPER